MKLPQISRLVLVRFLIAVSFVLLTHCLSLALNAQTPSQLYTHPELYVRIQDSAYVKRKVSGQWLDTNEYCFSAGYQFEMIYDSTCRVGYTFSECKLDNQRLRLKAWESGRITTAPIESYNDSTRTDNFLMSAGDTISFYREFDWYNPKTKKQGFDNYFSTDTINYIVELIDAATGNRLAVLDSLGALPTVPPGAPVLYGSHPVIALIKYAVPSSLADKTAFVRLKLDVRGDGLYQPVRMDTPTVGLSRELNLGMRDAYLQLFGDGLGKQSTLPSSFDSDRRQSRLLAVELTHDRNAVIKFNTAESDGNVAVVIYDELGSSVFVPFSTMNMSGQARIHYRFTAPGVFIIVLKQNNAIKATTKVVVD